MINAHRTRLTPKRWQARIGALLTSAALFTPAATAAQEMQTRAPALSTDDMFALAERARDQGDDATAMNAYRALASNPNIEIRTEARFRLALLHDTRGEHAEATELLRTILQEKPRAERVRLELSRILVAMGQERAALRELRRVDQGELPPEVRVVIDQFAGALRSREPIGGSISLALAPDTNINRATKADELDTVIAPLQLSEDAKAQSGVGLAIGAQGFVRKHLSDDVSVLARVSSQGDLYSDEQFNDVRVSAQIGLDWDIAKWRLSPSVGRTERWYGEEHYSVTNSATLAGRRPLANSKLVNFSLTLGEADYMMNDLQDGWIYDGSIGYERAFDAGLWGAGVTFSMQRQDAEDPGYATTSAGVQGVVWRRLDLASLFGSIGYRQLEADERLFLFPERRRDEFASASIGASFPTIRIGTLSPVVRLGYETNESSVDLYDYSRVTASFGLTRTF